MKVISGVYWDKGKRDANQDSLILEQVLTKKGRVVLAAVCDGIGGLKEGEVASGFIAERLREVFYDELIGLAVKGKSRKKIEKCFLRCCFEINDALQCYGEGKRVLLGATMSVLLLWKGHYMTVHLGDSRIFCLAGKKSESSDFASKITCALSCFRGDWLCSRLHPHHRREVRQAFSEPSCYPPWMA